ncbi:MAG: KH domain-containing protein [Kiritimatiellae bacterium]|jgi:hypothetical protein|nr:KH domain-containing protein [Kiritimatiellia bacterium]
MKSFLENILKALADYPDEVALSAFLGQQTVVFEVRCNSEDMGRIIGRSGKTIGAIRTLLGVLAAKQKKKSMLEIVE